MFKKVISILAVCLMLLAGLVGCGPKNDQEAIVGEWIWREINDGKSNFQKYTFEEDGIVHFQHSFVNSMRNADYTYELNDGTLILISDMAADCNYPYSFNEDFTVLTLTVNGVEIEFSKNLTDK